MADLGSGARSLSNLSLEATRLPNPASVCCEEHGSQYGVCVFPNGSECDEWAFYRGEWGPAGRAAGPSAKVEWTVECFDDCMIFARDIALAFVAEQYGQAVPALDAGWTLVAMEESIAAEGSPARIVHCFAAGKWTATVSYEVGVFEAGCVHHRDRRCGHRLCLGGHGQH